MPYYLLRCTATWSVTAPQSKASREQFPRSDVRAAAFNHSAWDNADPYHAMWHDAVATNLEWADPAMERCAVLVCVLE